ncbi:MAG: S1 RNA-binding domain-containing protein, partial [Prolixibacteraceae bacterium]
LETIPVPRAEYKPNVPRIEVMLIPKDMIGAVIGPGGKIIQGIQSDTGATIAITEDENNGIVEISGPNLDVLNAARARVKAIVALPEVGEIYNGKVKSIVSFGAFIEIMPGKEGLLHVTELDWKRVESASDILKENDMVEVKLIGIDEKTGKLKLSRRALLPKPEGYVEREQSRDSRPPRRDNHRGGDRRDDRRSNTRGGDRRSDNRGGDRRNEPWKPRTS